MKRRDVLAGIFALAGLSAAHRAWAQPPETAPLGKITIPTDVVLAHVKEVLQKTRIDEQGKETPINVVVLQQADQPRFLLIWIGETEAASILRSLNGEIAIRPMSHDLMASLVKALGGRVKSVTIAGMPQDGFYTAIIKVIGKGIEENVDSRPSDAIAFSLRADAPLYIENSLLEPLDIDEVRNRILAPKP